MNNRSFAHYTPSPRPSPSRERDLEANSPLSLEGEGWGEGDFSGEGDSPQSISVIRKARDLRRNSTDAERLLWQHLRNRRLNNHKFRRQHDIGCYVVDFVCLEKNLIIEADGGQHADDCHRASDTRRTSFLSQHGFAVLRFWNSDIMQNIGGVLQVITAALESIPQGKSHPHPNPLPERERGLEASSSPSLSGLE